VNKEKSSIFADCSKHRIYSDQK